MPNTEPPTLGEVLRRLDQVSLQLAEVAREIKADRADAAQTYVRQDVYIAERQASGAVVADLHGDIQALKSDTNRDVQALKDDRKSDAAFRRQVLLGFAIAGVGWLLTIALFIVTFMARGA